MRVSGASALSSTLVTRASSLYFAGIETAHTFGSREVRPPSTANNSNNQVAQISLSLLLRRHQPCRHHLDDRSDQQQSAALTSARSIERLACQRLVCSPSVRMIARSRCPCTGPPRITNDAVVANHLACRAKSAENKQPSDRPLVCLCGRVAAVDLDRAAAFDASEQVLHCHRQG